MKLGREVSRHNELDNQRNTHRFESVMATKWLLLTISETEPGLWDRLQGHLNKNLAIRLSSTAGTRYNSSVPMTLTQPHGPFLDVDCTAYSALSSLIPCVRPSVRASGILAKIVSGQFQAIAGGV